MLLQYETVQTGLLKFRDVMNFPLVGTTAETWLEDLSDLPDEAVKAAFDGVRRTFQPKFNGDRPTPGMLREWVLKQIAKNDSAAFNECIDAAARSQSQLYGRDKITGEFGPVALVWSSPLVKQAFDQFGGARAFNSITEEQLPTIRAQFRRLYGQLQVRAQAQAGFDIDSNIVSIDQAKQRQAVSDGIKSLVEAKGIK